MHAKEVANECIRETKTGKLSARAKDVALVAITCYSEQGTLSEYRDRIKTEFKRRNPGMSPVFLFFVLPLLANLISHFIIKWISRRNAGEIQRLKMEAFDALG
jgi:hypothetical protein